MTNRTVIVVLLGCALLLVALGATRAFHVLRPESYQTTGFTPRRALSAAVLDGRVFAAGGWNGEATLGTVEALDPATRRWRAAVPLTVARSQHALVAADGKLWALGGRSVDVGLVPEVEVLKPGQQSWTVVTRVPTPRREPAAALLGRRIVVAGGFNGRNDGDLEGYSDVVEAYDLDTGRWHTLARLPTPRRGLTMVAMDGYLYAIGGYLLGDGFLNTVERYDPVANVWQAMEWSLVPRTWAACVVVDGDVLIVGGYNGDGYLNLVERVNPRTGVACYPPPLRAARAWFAAVPLAEGILALGGEDVHGFPSAVEMIAPDCP